MPEARRYRTTGDHQQTTTLNVFASALAKHY